VSFGPASDAKEQVRQATDIVDLVGSYVQLRRQGRNFVGTCPWHDDSRPSLQVNAERQSYKCWVCDIGGDVFSFVMKMENVEFREALELLADRAGISLQPARPTGSGEPGSPPSATSEKKLLLRVMAWAEQQFHRCLRESPDAEAGRAYLADRRIAAETIDRFRLGFAPSRWDWLLERARRADIATGLLERAGLLRRRDTGDGFYDWFRGRVMFPIRDGRGRCIALGGRVLPQLADDRSAKYINSPETMLFSKSRELYGLDVARDAISKSNQAIVMEGYTDCLMAQQHGLDNVVAVLGTALGERHVHLLQQNRADSILLVLDGDDAGRRRTNEIIDSLLALFAKHEIDLKILTLPEGVDPCDFIATHGSDAFRQLLTGAVDALEHKFRSVTQGLDTTTDTHRASQAVEQVLATLAQIRATAAADASSPIMLREQQMLGRIAREFRLPEDQLRNRLTALRRGKQTRPVGARIDSEASTPAAPHRAAALTAWDRGVLELILLDPSQITRVELTVVEADFESEFALQVYETCRALFHDGQPVDFARLSLEFDDVTLKSLLVSIDESSQSKAAADRELWLQDLLAAAERRRHERTRCESIVVERGDAEAELLRLVEESRSKQLGHYERRLK
jgi:DNA primase